MEAIIRWFCRNHVAGNFAMVLILVLGITTWGTLKKEIFPETAIDAFAVTVPFPNATPEEVERGVVVPIEEAIQEVNGIKRVTSTASPGAGAVVVEVENRYRVRDVMADAKTRIDAIQNLAEEAEEPVFEELLIKSQVLSIAVSAAADERTLRTLAETVRDDLLVYQSPKSRTRIAQVTLAGARDYEISIEVSEGTLRQYGITFDQVAAAVRASSLDLPGGSVRTQAGEIQIRTERRRYTAPEFARIPVLTRPNGSRVLLEDLATIRDAFEEDDLSTRLDGQPALLLNVFRIGNQDTLEIARLAKEYVYEVAPSVYPPGVSLEIWRDDSVYLAGRMRLLAKNGAFGLVLVFLTLALFLRPSLAGLVALGIPVSFAGAVALMPWTGISINLISLFAFILVLGIVVDDAIVIGENVYRRMRLGEHPREAAPNGTHEVGIVVIFGVLTTVVAFTPMLGLSGVSGKIWPNIPLIVIPTLLFSLFQSKLILPSHLACLVPYDPHRKVGPVIRFQRLFSRGLERFVERSYRPVLRFCLHHRYVVLTAFLSALILVVCLVAFGFIKTRFFPEVEGDLISAKLEMARGAPFAATEEAVLRLEAAAIRIRDEFPDQAGRPVIRHMLTSAGTQPFDPGSARGLDGVPKGTHLGEVTLELQPAVNRELTGSEIAAIWREYAGPIPGAVQLTFQAETASGGSAIDLELTGNDLDELEAATAEVKQALASYTGVIDIASSNRAGNREIKLDILPAAEALGLRLHDVARQVRQGFYGEEVQRLQRGRDEVKVFVRYPREERRSLSQLASMKIRNQDGAEVPFAEVATAASGRADASIRRSDRRRAVNITADVDTALANANEVVASLIHRPSAEHPLPLAGPWGRLVAGGTAQSTQPEGILAAVERKYPGIRYTFQGEQKDQHESVTQIGQKAVLALLFMYVLMAVPLRSYVQPLIVMSVIPFGLVGAVLGHVLFRLDLSVMSMCGIVALAGVVVNDSLVLVDYVNRERARGAALVEAAWEAGAARFRPILLTSLTTFAGLTPMILETDLQAKFLIPMAISLAFGVVFATVITLVLIPSIYLILDDFLVFLKTRLQQEATGS